MRIIHHRTFFLELYLKKKLTLERFIMAAFTFGNDKKGRIRLYEFEKKKKKKKNAGCQCLVKPGYTNKAM